jgi:arylsulfatase A-like enzyme
VLDLYGPDVKTPGTFAANCLQARRLAERGVRFIQLYHQDWDHHGGLPGALPRLCKETDQAAAALVKDLKQRGLLDDTLVVWGGEFGRTNYCQGKIQANFGRDHHPRCFTAWMAGGGVKAGQRVYGETDEFGYNVAGRRAHPRLPRHDAAPAGHRSRATDLQVPGPALPPDRCPRSCGVGLRVARR